MNYQSAKQQLKQIAKEVKRNNKNDKPLCRQVINDSCDSLLRELNRTASDKKAKQQESWLSSYAASLHP